MHHKDNLDRNGFSVEESILDPRGISRIRDQLEALVTCDAVRSRRNSIFGARNLLQVVPSLRNLIESDRINSCVKQLIGDQARPIRSLFFDKTSAANWTVLWHQDLTIAVREKITVGGFGPWTMKAGVPHVQPPISVLEKMLTLRIHLDDTDESNGALRVIPGSHRSGRLNPTRILQLTATAPEICSVAAGGVLLMKPLLLHSSSSCKPPSHRRVLHIEFSAERLPGGLECYGQ